MLEDIRKKGLTAQQFISQVKDKKSGMRLMGFGHRVYKNFDPRAKIIKRACDEVLDKLASATRCSIWPSNWKRPR